MRDEYWIKEAMKWCDAEYDAEEYVLWLACNMRDEEDED